MLEPEQWAGQAVCEEGAASRSIITAGEAPLLLGLSPWEAWHQECLEGCWVIVSWRHFYRGSELATCVPTSRRPPRVLRPSMDIPGSSGRDFVPDRDRLDCVCFSIQLWQTGRGPL